MYLKMANVNETQSVETPEEEIILPCFLSLNYQSAVFGALD